MQIRESFILPWMVLVIGVFFIVQLQARLPPPVVKRMNLAHSEAAKTADAIRQAWNPDMCNKLTKLIRQKDILVKKIEQLAGSALMKQVKEDDIETDMQLATFRVFVRELNETEALIIQSLVWLDSVLKGDYHDLINLKESSKLRLDALRDATLKEEQEYNAILKAEEKMKVINESQVEGVLNDILKDVAKAADQLEENIGDNAFDDAMLDPHLARDMIEAVIRLEGGDTYQNESKRDTSNTKSNAGRAGIIKLVDSQNNQFVLSRAKDNTLPVEDHNLIQDVVILMISSFIFGWMGTFLSLPPMFGYIVGGICVGPSGLNVLKSLVQIETLGEFGVVFILFTVGLEFSPARIQKVFVPASLATLLMTVLLLFCGVCVGLMLGAAIKECVFIAICLSLSSTPLVVKFLNPPETTTESPSNTEYGVLLLGILIMQDVVLGLFIAFLPIMADPISNPHLAPAAVYTLIIVQLISALTLVLLICIFIAKVIVGPLFKQIQKGKSKEMMLLASIVVTFTMLKITEYVGISMELGCFLAGVIISAQDHELADEVEHLIEPVKDFLSVIFFASIGLHVFPQFFAYEMTIITSITMATVGIKYVISVFVLAIVTRKTRSSWPIKWIVYLLILGVTTLSLVFAPVIWKVTLWQMRLRAPPSFSFISSTLGLGEVGKSTSTSNSQKEMDIFQRLSDKLEEEPIRHLRHMSE
ncbi:hypothetical protein LSH36_24g05021 [Paralvinella palmiformis]|uniref:Cation/H+ exchanger transmembrane domain-containing protein n=1 Tax=Paralvinella palmiformis TaxID=53620 RepID=A0AAD9KAU8_9ANNE|nr:hypothetical protein LSH36_24g05021 [Paralvinella palmiformis]